MPRKIWVTTTRLAVPGVRTVAENIAAARALPGRRRGHIAILHSEKAGERQSWSGGGTDEEAQALRSMF